MLFCWNLLLQKVFEEWEALKLLKFMKVVWLLLPWFLLLLTFFYFQVVSAMNLSGFHEKATHITQKFQHSINFHPIQQFPSSNVS